ncbi:YqhG family protein [Brevibacillus marinus]|uniref:YqhG family protein n=1 Tax=Brevibacillus marinus TaxID=2496837 RepID=UPI000F8246EA|nr:YqhG family protein [Brevibacillus marinus]
MNQEEVRRYTERYFAAFSAHVLESHPAYFTVKLPEIVDKDIGNRPFYWSWVEKMNIPPQPLTLTFCFAPEQMPEGKRCEYLHFGSSRLAQIFRSARNHGRYVCLYEQAAAPTAARSARRRASAPLVPWLNVNLKISFVCDKKRDVLLSYGVNLHQPAIVHNFYPSLRTLPLGPAIPDYFYTLDRQLSLEQAAALVEREVNRFIARQDQRWAEEACARLQEEISILTAYYDNLAESDRPADEQPDDTSTEQQQAEQAAESAAPPAREAHSPLPPAAAPALLPANEQSHQAAQPAVPAAVAAPAAAGSILAFLRQHTIPETPTEEIDQSNWQQSTPAEEKARRIAELKWQYEPRIEVSVINAGLFYLARTPAGGSAAKQ